MRQMRHRGNITRFGCVPAATWLLRCSKLMQKIRIPIRRVAAALK
jgi:hypothetical protein